MKPKQKTPAKKRDQKHISLVIPEKKTERQAEAADQIAAEPETTSTQPAEGSTPPARAEKKTPAPGQAKSDHKKVAREIADELGETATWPRYQIHHIVWALGSKQALKLARKAKDIEAAGGMFIESKQRRRSLGGIFFHLVYSEGQPRPGCTLKRPEWKPRARPDEQPAPAQDEAQQA